VVTDYRRLRYIFPETALIVGAFALPLLSCGCAVMCDAQTRPLCAKLIAEGVLGGVLFGVVKVLDLRMRFGKRLTLRRAFRDFRHECVVGLVAGLLTATLVSLVVLCGK
jgi:hypothetical protein